jgi:hypothetical protein
MSRNTYSSDNDLKLVLLPTFLDLPPIPLAHTSVIEPCSDLMLFPQDLRDIFTLRPGAAVDDSRRTSSLHLDVTDHIIDDLLVLRSDLVMKVGPVKRLLENNASADTKGPDDIVLHLVLRSGRQRHDRHAGIVPS